MAASIIFEKTCRFCNQELTVLENYRLFNTFTTYYFCHSCNHNCTNIGPNYKSRHNIIEYPNEGSTFELIILNNQYMIQYYDKKHGHGTSIYKISEDTAGKFTMLISSPKIIKFNIINIAQCINKIKTLLTFQ